MKPKRFTKCNLGKILKERGYILTDAAEYIGVSYQQIQKYAAGVNEMSLRTLFDFCEYLKCTPQDIYPEIEFYDKGINIPASQKVVQGEEIYQEEKSLNQEQDNNEAKIVHIKNNYHYNGMGFNLFNNIRLLDINQRGALFIKLAIWLVIIDNLFYIVFRLFGLSYPPFFEGNLLNQLMWGWMMIFWPISFIVPLILTHWLSYSLIVITFHSMLSMLYSQVNFGIMPNTIDTQLVWIIKFVIATLLTLGYSYIVNKYLRKHIRIKLNKY